MSGKRYRLDTNAIVCLLRRQNALPQGASVRGVGGNFHPLLDRVFGFSQPERE